MNILMDLLLIFINKVQIKQDVCQNIGDAETIIMTIQVPTLVLIYKSYEASKKSIKRQNCGPKSATRRLHVAPAQQTNWEVRHAIRQGGILVSPPPRAAQLPPKIPL